MPAHAGTRPAPTTTPGPSRPRNHQTTSGTYLPVEGRTTMTTITFDEAVRTHPGRDQPAVDARDLHVEDGGFLVLAGPRVPA